MAGIQSKLSNLSSANPHCLLVVFSSFQMYSWINLKTITSVHVVNVMLLLVNLCFVVTPYKNSKNKFELCQALNTSVNKMLLNNTNRKWNALGCTILSFLLQELSLLVFSDTQLEIEGSYSWEMYKLGTINLHLSNLGENLSAGTAEMHFQCRWLSIS